MPLVSTFSSACTIAGGCNSVQIHVLLLCGLGGACGELNSTLILERLVFCGVRPVALPCVVIRWRRIIDLGEIQVVRLRRASAASFLHSELEVILPLLFCLLLQASCGTLPCLLEPRVVLLVLLLIISIKLGR